MPEIARRLVTGEKVVLQEFGTFTVERAKARARFDFAVGATLKKPERFFIKFAPCKELASEVQRAHLKRAKKRDHRPFAFSSGSLTRPVRCGGVV